ncbi:MAG TPA: hypothetical protein VGP46_03835 [Acidimicrobiales bacterium]|nr:hypothetical protein [Acidimicrobiales bacterium]
MSAGTTSDRFAPARGVADAVMREGQVLYPYRASSPKNQQRWQFGVLAPSGYVERHGSESATMRVECLVEAGRRPAAITVCLRFVRLESRQVEEAVLSGDAPGLAGGRQSWQARQDLDLDGDLHTSWDESIEEEHCVGPIEVGPGVASAAQFGFAGSTRIEQLRSGSGEVAGRLVRTCESLAAELAVAVVDVGCGLFRLAIEVRNTTHWEREAVSRTELVRSCLLACHMVLAADSGRFVSLLDPPERAKAAAQACSQQGCFPVLVGTGGSDDLVLVSPIILYDHPEVAPESPGEMCDATEIDEILALRTLTLTDQEKRQARATDGRAAAIVDLVDDMTPEVFERLHGAVRSLAPASPAPAQSTPALSRPDLAGSVPSYGPAASKQAPPWWDPAVDASVDPSSDSVTVAGHRVSAGTAVVLRPGHGADAQDMFLQGRSATVTGVFHDVDGEVHVAVTVDDDPAADLHDWYGRFRYFRPFELEVHTR